MQSFALIVILCNADSYCYEAIPSVWDNREECLIKGIPSFSIQQTLTEQEQQELATIDNIVFYCAPMEAVSKMEE